MNKLTLWIIRNSALGSILGLFFGEDWIEKKPNLLSGVKLFFYAIYLMAILGLVLSFSN